MSYAEGMYVHNASVAFIQLPYLASVNFKVTGWDRQVLVLVLGMFVQSENIVRWGRHTVTNNCWYHKKNKKTTTTTVQAPCSLPDTSAALLTSQSIDSLGTVLLFSTENSTHGLIKAKRMNLVLQKNQLLGFSWSSLGCKRCDVSATTTKSRRAGFLSHFTGQGHDKSRDIFYLWILWINGIYNRSISGQKI